MLKVTQLDIPFDEGENLPRGPTANDIATPFFYRDMET
jgi:hypothetical protein